MSRLDPIPDPLDGPPLRWYEIALVPVFALAAVAVFLVGVVRFMALASWRRR